MRLLEGLLDIEEQEEEIGNAFTASSYGFSREMSHSFLRHHRTLEQCLKRLLSVQAAA